VRTGAWTIVVALTMAAPAAADTVNFDLAGRIYTKWLYRNDDSQGVLSLGNPFWPDDIAGDNGAGTEFELKIFGRVSKYVQAYARLQSRFGEMWQDWWESGERKWEYAGVENTSGDSLGMNRASYIKLRGTYVRVAIPIPSLDWVTVGSSDLGMFNPWTIGKIRYIDRDNAKGIFLDGHVGEGIFSYSGAVIALPKLWVGPWWSTGIGDPAITNAFYTQDWAYGAKFVVAPEWGTFTLISTLTNDVEIDVTDPDVSGSAYPTCEDDLGNPIAGCTKDHAADYFSRYLNSVTTLEVQAEPLDWLSLNAFGAFSLGNLDKRFDANGVEQNQGVSPVLYKDTRDFAVRLRVEAADPFRVGLSLKGEYFYVGPEWNTIFGARRESDVLLTDGFLGGGQLPTLNLANEFVDFDEPWFESCIGWHGGTLIAQYSDSGFTGDVEGTYIRYNTNAQNRDVDTVYPTFLHSEGYTDIDLYDYANTTDRGRDPRSVYRKDQDRQSAIAVLNLRHDFDALHGIELSAKVKYVFDQDYRSHTTADDDYVGHIVQSRVKLAMGVAEGLRIELGSQYDWWHEDRRKGTLQLGYGDDLTVKSKSAMGFLHDKVPDWAFGILSTVVPGTLGISYEFEGVKFRWYFEYLVKDQFRERETDQYWAVFRSKASLEVNW
jgi:hypothetical protein